jgi:energy-converting hydrogenase A subunit M
MKIKVVKTEGLEKRVNQIFERYNWRTDVVEELGDEHFYIDNEERTEPDHKAAMQALKEEGYY